MNQVIFTRMACVLAAGVMLIVTGVGFSAAVEPVQMSGIGGTAQRPATASGSQAVPMAMPDFSELSTGTTSGQMSTVSMGFVDNDGYAEIISGDGGRSAGTKGLYLWQYDGSTWNKQTVEADGCYGGVKLADITGDGILDIAAAGESFWSYNSNSKGVLLWKGSYSGSTISFSPLPSPYSSTSSDDVDVADIDGDGHNDIVLGTHGDGIKVFINDGNDPPSWTTIPLTATSETSGVAIGDLDGTSGLDIVATPWGGQSSRVFLCSGLSPVTFDTAHTSGLGTGTAYGISINDFNGDTKIDLAIGTGNGFKVYLGNGCSGPDTSWWTPGTVSGGTGSSTRMQVTSGDINKDGYMDIAFASGSGIVVLENDGTGSFTKVNPVGIPTSSSYYGCCLFDWDKDGDLDLAACGWGRGVHFYQNNMYSVPELAGSVGAVLIFCPLAALVLLLKAYRRPRCLSGRKGNRGI